MARLSIIIPAAADANALEDTLVSVLSNRPRDCEIIVPHADSYNDPYELGDEVRFLEMKSNSSASQLISQAIHQSHGEFLHLLSPGCEVVAGWSDTALAAFRDENIASVSPAVASEFEAETAIIGVYRKLLGGRGEVSCRLLRNDQARSQAKVLGPTCSAAFYRRAALDAIAGWPSRIEPRLADLDLALSLAAAGYETAVEPSALVVQGGRKTVSVSAFGHARDQERLFWRHHGGAWASLTHPLVIVGQCLFAGGPGRILLSAAGKLASLLDVAAGRRHQRMLRAQAQSWALELEADRDKPELAEDHQAESPRAAA